MTLATNLAASVQEAVPEFFFLQCGNTVERWTSYPTALTFGGYVYNPAPIKRGKIQRSSNLSASTVSVEAPVTDLLARYIANNPVEKITLIIYRALKSDLTSYGTIFNGTIKGIGIKNGWCRVTATHRSAILSTIIPKFVHQAYCNHEVFDTNCGLIDMDYAVTGACTTFASAYVEAAEFSAFTDGYFKGGKVQLDTDWRLITEHVGVRLTLQVQFDSRLMVGEMLTAFPGCDGSPETCDARFNNLGRFLGDPYIPSKNPMVWGLR